MAQGSGIDLLGLLQYQRSQARDQRSTITDLMKVLNEQAKQEDTDASYDEGIESIQNISKDDEYTSLIGDLLVKDLTIEKAIQKRLSISSNFT